MMKKLTLTITMVLVACLSIHAQDADVGIKVGTSLSNFMGPDTKDFTGEDGNNMKLDITGALAFNSKVADHVWLKHEIFFTRKGAEGAEGSQNRLYYVDVYPISVAGHYEGAQLFVGPTVGVLVYRDEVEKDGKVIVPDEPRKDYNEIDIGVVAGLEYQFEFGLNAGARYVRGFSSIREPIEDPGTGNKIQVEMFNQAFLFTIGYSFGD